MKNKPLLYLFILSASLHLGGCVGYNPPHVLQMKPYTIIKGGDQIGRDQLANRWLIAQSKIPLKGKDKNEVLTWLGQPQQIEIIQHQVSEDWYYIYYTNYKVKPLEGEGSFLVRFYNDKVIDIVKLN